MTLRSVITGIAFTGLIICILMNCDNPTEPPVQVEEYVGHWFGYDTITYLGELDTFFVDLEVKSTKEYTLGRFHQKIMYNDLWVDTAIEMGTWSMNNDTITLTPTAWKELNDNRVLVDTIWTDIDFTPNKDPKNLYYNVVNNVWEITLIDWRSWSGFTYPMTKMVQFACY